MGLGGGVLLVVGCASVGRVFLESEQESEENDHQGSNSTWFFLPVSPLQS